MRDQDSTEESGQDFTPQWLREVLKRGFVPPKSHNLFATDDMFSHIPVSGEKIQHIPDKRIYVLEGLPGSGKTSIANYFTVKENILALSQILPIEPKFDQAMPVSFYVKSEELKTQKIKTTGEQAYLLDRYYVSTMAFYWACDKLRGTREYPEVFSWYKRSVEKGKILKPFRTFLIQIPVDESLKRKNRQPSNNLKNLWLNKRFLAHVNNYYDYFYQVIEPHSTLVTIDGLLPLKQILSYVRATLICEE